jgi:hypothetical protein
VIRLFRDHLLSEKAVSIPKCGIHWFKRPCIKCFESGEFITAHFNATGRDAGPGTKKVNNKNNTEEFRKLAVIDA